jgi:uncharacterized beta barrel domain-containing protein DUF5777
MLGALLALLVASSAPPADDRDVDPVEPDFTVINMPTNLRLPRHALAFRLTHRFARGLGEGDFDDLLADFFGFDGGAQIGLELRFSAFTGNHLGIYRTSDRTIEFFAQQELMRETDAPVGLGLLASIEGLDNFTETYSPRVGVVLSRRLGSRGAIYASPAWIGNVRPASDPATSGDDDDGTLLVGLGARIRLAETFSITGEIHPRLAGYTGHVNGAPLASFGLEGRVGGHVFQLNFSNDLGTTPAQVARGRTGVDDWFIGFNISRKFY